MLIVFICILIYVVFCFEWCFVVGVVLVLLYDVIIILGLFLILGFEFDLMIFVVILVVIGYLFNDIIVVFDCICENFCKVCIDDIIEIIDILLM